MMMRCSAPARMARRRASNSSSRGVGGTRPLLVSGIPLAFISAVTRSTVALRCSGVSGGPGGWHSPATILLTVTGILRVPLHEGGAVVLLISDVIVEPGVPLV